MNRGRFRYPPGQLVHGVEDIILGDLCEVHGDIVDWLVPPLAFLVQHTRRRLVELNFWPRSWCEGGVTGLHAKALEYVLRVVFLVDGARALFAVTSYLHAERP